MSSGYCIRNWEGNCLGVCLTSLKAVVEAAKEPVEKIALCSSMPIDGETPTVVVRSSTDGETDGSKGPQIADRSQMVILDSPMQDDEVLAAGAGDRHRLQAWTIRTGSGRRRSPRADGLTGVRQDRVAPTGKIGRASCRERV